MGREGCGADRVDFARRFGGLDRLYGAGACQRLARLHVIVAGIGGVGTWCAEALARSGVGALTLVDLDHIAESNINRQAHALSSTLGKAKVRAMADRIGDINPACQVGCIDDFVEAGNVTDIFARAGRSPALATGASGPAGGPSTAAGDRLTVLVDCTDQVPAKVAMVLQARAQGLPLLCCGGAGGKTDPLSLRAGDLSLAAHDALLGRLRQQLRSRHGYPKGGRAGGKPLRRVPRMGVSCLWFDQPVVLPAAWAHTRQTVADAARAGAAGGSDDAMRAGIAAGSDAVARAGVAGEPDAAARALPQATRALAQGGDALQGLSCAGYGSVVTVTASMGMMAANWALDQGLHHAA